MLYRLGFTLEVNQVQNLKVNEIMGAGQLTCKFVSNNYIYMAVPNPKALDYIEPMRDSANLPSCTCNIQKADVTTLAAHTTTAIP